MSEKWNRVEQSCGCVWLNRESPYRYDDIWRLYDGLPSVMAEKICDEHRKQYDAVLAEIRRRTGLETRKL